MSESVPQPTLPAPTDRGRPKKHFQSRNFRPTPRGGGRRGGRQPDDPALSTVSSPQPSALGLDTCVPEPEASSAPESANPTTSMDAVDQGNDRSRSSYRGRPPRGPKRFPKRYDTRVDQEDADASHAPNEVTSSIQIDSAPNTQGATHPDQSQQAARGGGRGRGNGGRDRGRGNFSRGYGGKRFGGNRTGNPTSDLAPSDANTEQESSSGSSSLVATPTNSHSNLVPTDETPASQSSSTPWSDSQSREAKEPEAPQLDAWAEVPPDEDMWKSDSVEAYTRLPAIATSSPRYRDAQPTRHDIRTPPMPPPRPAPVEPPQQAQASRPSQPPIDDAPTSMRRIGLAHVLLGPGACVQHVFTDAESPWVMLSNLPRSTRKYHVQELVAPFGSAHYIRVYPPQRDTKYLPTARILFDRHEQARDAAKALHGRKVVRETITARLDTNVSGAGLNGRYIPGLPSTTSSADAQGSLVDADPAAVLRNSSVKVSWLAPTSTVYATYATPKFALERIKDLNGRTFANRRVRMTAMFSDRGKSRQQVAQDNGGYMVRITGLMGNPNLEALRRFLRTNDLVVNPNYSSELGLTKLREALADVAPLESFRLLPNRRDDFKLHAVAQYTTPSAAAAAVRVFDQRQGEYLANSRIWVNRNLTVRYSISARLTEVLQGEINKLHAWAIDDPDLQVRQHEDPRKPGCVQLTLSGNDTKQLVTAKAQLDRALAGVPLMSPDGLKIWDSFFTTEEGSAFLESTATETKICARADKRTNSVLLFGPGYARNNASKILLEKLQSLASLRQTMIIPKPVFRRLQLGGLTILRDLVGKAIYVDFFRQSLTFYGDQQVVERVRKAIDVMYSEVGSRLQRHSDCVICLCKPERGIVLHCGHHYCKECFSQYVESAADNRTLPLVCVGQDCKTPVPLSMIALHSSQSGQDALFFAAFQDHVVAHQDQYRFCPTPDCQYIYRVGPEDSIVQCRLCLTNICTHCHVEQHESITCADYKASHDESEIQKSFKKWQAKHDVKPCPGCSAPIEKIAGCNHMMCASCRTHMCWVCLAGFKTGEEVYDHMRGQHGGIGL